MASELGTASSHSRQLNLSWSASTDNVGVQGYRVYRDGLLAATVGTPAFSDTGLAAGSAHSYTVAAFDGKGNASAQSATAGGTAQAPVRSTTYAYDLADRLTGISPQAGPAVTLTLDALGRHKTRVSGGLTDTYTYAGESAAIVRIAPSTGTAVNSVVDATGARLAVSTGAGGFGWTLDDLHGNVAGYASAGGGLVTDATRYDPYGEVVAQTSSGLPAPWGYQGRLDLAAAADTDLLDFGFRPYAPDLGAFTSPDDLAGSALNPLTFNRYLYAAGNPATLVDPDGHAFRNLTDGGSPGTLRAGVSGRSPASQARDRAAEERVTSRTVVRRVEAVTPPSVRDGWVTDMATGRWPTDEQVQAGLSDEEIAVRRAMDACLTGGGGPGTCGRVGAIMRNWGSPASGLAAIPIVAAILGPPCIASQACIGGLAAGAGSFLAPIEVANIQQGKPLTDGINPVDLGVASASGPILWAIGGSALTMTQKVAASAAVGLTGTAVTMKAGGRLTGPESLFELTLGTVTAGVGPKIPIPGAGPGLAGFGRAVFGNTAVGAGVTWAQTQLVDLWNDLTGNR